MASQRGEEWGATGGRGGGVSCCGGSATVVGGGGVYPIGGGETHPGRSCIVATRAASHPVTKAVAGPIHGRDTERGRATGGVSTPSAAGPPRRNTSPMDPWPAEGGGTACKGALHWGGRVGSPWRARPHQPPDDEAAVAVPRASGTAGAPIDTRVWPGWAVWHGQPASPWSRGWNTRARRQKKIRQTACAPQWMQAKDGMRPRRGNLTAQSRQGGRGATHTPRESRRQRHTKREVAPHKANWSAGLTSAPPAFLGKEGEGGLLVGRLRPPPHQFERPMCTVTTPTDRAGEEQGRSPGEAPNPALDGPPSSPPTLPIGAQEQQSPCPPLTAQGSATPKMIRKGGGAAPGGPHFLAGVGTRRALLYSASDGATGGRHTYPLTVAGMSYPAYHTCVLSALQWCSMGWSSTAWCSTAWAPTASPLAMCSPVRPGGRATPRMAGRGRPAAGGPGGYQLPAPAVPPPHEDCL